MRTNYVLIDFENVQPKNLGLLKSGPFKVKIFLGANQSKIHREIALAVHSFGPDAEYIEIEGNGSNALDFHIAYYIGQLAHETPDAFFHIISKDTGFDPLIKHLKTQKVSCQRSTSLQDIPLLKVQNATSAKEKVDAVVGNLISRKASKPRKLTTLRSTIHSIFAKNLSDHELDSLINHLRKQGFITLKDEKIIYTLPE